MRKLIVTSLTLSLILVFSGAAIAAEYIYNPVPPDMLDLSHAYYFSWSIDDFALDPGEVITEAELTITNMWDSGRDPNNMLYIHLLDAAPTLPLVISSNLSRAYDGRNYSDDWANAGPLVATWHDPYGDWYHRTSVTFDFNAAQIEQLTQFIQNGDNFGFGFDPDCAFNNQGITFEITTAVPEPSALILLGSALSMVAVVLRRRAD